MNESIKTYLSLVTSLQQVNFYQLVQAAMQVERSEVSSKERFQKKKFSRGASSSSRKRSRESPAELVYILATRGRRQGLMWHLVMVKVLQLDKEKPHNALITIDDILVFVDY